MAKAKPPIKELFDRKDAEDIAAEPNARQRELERMVMSPTFGIAFSHFIYEDLLIPQGALPLDKRAHACWNYYVKAMKSVQKVGKGIDDQIIYDDQPWRDLHFREQAMAVANQYGLESPDEMFKFWDYVDKQADLLGIPRAHDLIRRGINP